MPEKLIYEGESPKTQSLDAVKNLLKFVGRAADPLPSEVSLDGGRLMLVLSNKRDGYYCVTAKACSCPSATYRPGQTCKHQRKHFGARPEAKEPASTKFATWHNGMNGPVMPEDVKGVA